MGGHCRCSFGCGAIDRTRAGCSCTGGKSHRCRGGGDPEDLEKQRKKERERKKETGTGEVHEERKEKEKEKENEKVTVNVTVNVTTLLHFAAHSYALCLSSCSFGPGC